ncbi:MAG: nuclear transport factor 2 family protein [Bacteroidetes bacterium]|nr:nuclear transport factor 2 family protein [Bacteroidota bacterium]
MKKVLYALFVAAIVFTSCQTNTKTVPFDSAAAKADLTKTLDKIYLAMNSRDTVTLFSFMADDGLFCGTDPKEFWDKKTYSGLMAKLLADPAYTAKISVDKREIRLDKTGNSAVVIDQFFGNWSKQVQVRNVYHFINVDNKWMFDFSSLTFIPANEDMPAIFNALK